LRAKFLTLGLLLGILIGGVAGFDLAGLGYVREVTRSLTVTNTSYATSYITSTATATVSQQLKWLYPDQQVVSYLDSGKYVGQIKTVEGTIVRTDHSSSNTIFLYFHDPYKGYFVVVIYSSDFSRFKFTPDVFYHGKEVRVTGKIQLSQSAPQIVVRDLSQIEVAYMGFNYP
jgi:micrococcal nuclease